MLSLIETFIELYETKSFTKTAQNLFLTQPTVTARIKKLEENINTTLFIRTSLRTIIPTEAADIFYPEALYLLDFWEKTQIDLISPPKTKGKLSFVLAFSPNASSLFFDHIFKIIEEYIDQINLKCYIYDSQTIVEMIEDQRIDFAIIERPLHNRSIENFIFAEDDLVWAGIESSQTFISLEIQAQTGPYIKQFFKEQDYNPNHTITMSNNHLIIESLIAGIGSTLTSSLLVPSHIPHKYLGKSFHRNFLGVYSKQNQNTLFLKIVNKIKKNPFHPKDQNASNIN